MALDLKDLTNPEYVIDTIFTTLQEAWDGDMQAAYTIAVIMATVEQFGYFSPETRQVADIRSQILQKIYKMDVKGLDLKLTLNELQRSTPQLVKLYPNGVPTEIKPFTHEQVNSILKLQKDTKLLQKYGNSKIISDRGFRQAVTIADIMGMFGFLEGDKIGTLDVYALALLPTSSHIEIPFDTVGDNKVCVNCRGLELKGPYRPEDYPKSPHPGSCRCGPGKPVLVKD